MFAYFQKHHEISPVVFPMVDFDIIGRILKNKQNIRQCVKTSTTSGIRWQYAANGSGVPLTYVLYVVLRMKHWTMLYVHQFRQFSIIFYYAALPSSYIRDLRYRDSPKDEICYNFTNIGRYMGTTCNKKNFKKI